MAIVDLSKTAGESLARGAGPNAASPSGGLLQQLIKPSGDCLPQINSRLIALCRCRTYSLSDIPGSVIAVIALDLQGERPKIAI